MRERACGKVVLAFPLLSRLVSWADSQEAQVCLGGSAQVAVGPSRCVADFMKEA
jgi:hypothetical protein